MKRIYAIAFAGASMLFAVSCSKSVNEPTNADSEIQAQSHGSDEAGEDRIVFTQVVRLEGSQEVPAVMTETKGIAILRVSASKILYSKIIIQKLADGDALRFAHVHEAPFGVNGPVRITLAANAADFGINKEIPLTDAQYNLLLSGTAYVNAHSNFYPGGIVRGQIR